MELQKGVEAMDRKEKEKLLNSPEYQFLRTEPDLKEGIFLLGFSGSYSCTGNGQSCISGAYCPDAKLHKLYRCDDMVADTDRLYRAWCAGYDRSDNHYRSEKAAYQGER